MQCGCSVKCVECIRDVDEQYGITVICSIIVCIATASIAASCSTFVNNGELSKLKVCIWRPYCVFLHSGERDHVADLLTLKAKWFATLT